MSLKQKTVLGIPITTSSEEIILEEIKKGLKRTYNRAVEPLIIFTPNPEIVMYAQRDKEFKRIVASAQINIPDGWGICWALRRIYGQTVPRISGVDFMENLCQKSEDWSFRVGLLGGSPSVALKAKECLQARFPRLEVEVVEVGEIEIVRGLEGGRWIRRIRNQHDEMNQYIDAVVKQIQKKDIRILFVALGFPKQEYLIDMVRQHLIRSSLRHSIVLMAVGGSLDYLSGRVPRAPKWLRERGGEWVYRLLREPGRLGRQIRGSEFFWRMLRSLK